MVAGAHRVRPSLWQRTFGNDLQDVPSLLIYCPLRPGIVMWGGVADPHIAGAGAVAGELGANFCAANLSRNRRHAARSTWQLSSISIQAMPA